MPDGVFLPVVLAVAGVAAAALLAMSGAALRRRRSLSYLLVTLALGTLLLRSLLGTVTLGGVVTDHLHHVVEHVLDLVVVALLLAAVYAARRIDPRVPTADGLEDHDE